MSKSEAFFWVAYAMAVASCIAPDIRNWADPANGGIGLMQGAVICSLVLWVVMGLSYLIVRGVRAIWNCLRGDGA